MGNFNNQKGDPVTPKFLRRGLRDPLGLFDAPKTPKPSAQEVELERRQRKAINDLTRESNARLKGLKRGTVGRSTLLGGAGARGILSGSGGGGGSSGGPSRPGRFGGAGRSAGGAGRRAGILGPSRRR